MTLAGDCFVRSCLSLHNTPAAVLCVLLSALQMAFMDYYLISMISTKHLVWLGADGLNLCLLVFCIVQARQALNQETNAGNVHSLAWVSWFLMNTSVSAKVCVLIHYSMEDLENEQDTFWSANTFKTTIALGACIFLLLLITQHDAALGSDGRRYIEELTGTVVFDVLDTVEIFDTLLVLEDRKMLWPALEEAIVAVAVLNLLLPTVPLLTLARTQFGRKKLRKRLIYTHRILVVLIVNVPNLVVRMILWHGHNMGVSPFTLKNVVLILLTSYEFYEHKKTKLDQRDKEKKDPNCAASPDSEQSKSNRRSSNTKAEDIARSKDSGGVPLAESGASVSKNRQLSQYEGDFSIESRVVTF